MNTVVYGNIACEMRDVSANAKYRHCCGAVHNRGSLRKDERICRRRHRLRAKCIVVVYFYMSNIKPIP